MLDDMNLKSIFDNIDVGVTVTNKDAQIIYVNSAQLKRSYYTYQDYMKMNVRLLYKSKVSDTCLFDVVCDTKKAVTAIQRTYHSGDNSSYEKLVTAVPIFDSEGNIVNVVSTYIDLEIFRGKYTQALLSNEVSLRPSVEKTQEMIIYKSDKMQKILKLAESVANTDSSILIHGESGVGKEVITDFIHNNSVRSGHKLVSINCATIPESLFESELFGYEKGAFTGASPAGKAGLIESADGGTIFLDEINSMPLVIQGKLLRVLETKSIKRIGSLKEKSIDFRVISAANVRLSECIERGTFRQDLYYRLNVIPIDIPPLRERREDIIPLCHYFLKHYCEKYGKIKLLSKEATKTLENYNWPGNVRELKNFIERLVLTSADSTGEIHTIPLQMLSQNSLPSGYPENAQQLMNGYSPAAMHELINIIDALKRCSGNRVHTAKLLGISRRALQYKLKKYKISTHLEPKIYVNSKLY